MLCKIESQFPVTDAAAKNATGKTLKEWFADLDTRNMLAAGRRNAYLYLYHECKLGEWWSPTIAVEYEKARGQVVKKDGLAEGYGICVTKTIAAPLDKLYAAWTDSAALSKWFGAGTKAKVADGGAYENKDGDRGKFLRVRDGKDLRLSWENPAFSSASLIDVVFSDKGGGKSHVMLNHSRIQTRAEADALRSGWGDAFDKLKKMLEKG